VGSRAIRLLMVGAFAVSASLLPGPPVTAAEPGNASFERTWNRTDRPVIEQHVNRTWMWGPQAFTGPMMEATTDRPGVGRQVQYFDKSRMELSLDPAVGPYSIWRVTNGLLARELVTGMLQLGDTDFEARPPATVNVAGDWDDPSGPTYASFELLLSIPALEPGAPVVERIDREGNVTADPGLAARGVTVAVHVPETGHSVASPFWEFMNASGLVATVGPPQVGALFPNPFYATGYPISEAYWANVKVAGEYRDVLMQVFERRVLTYTPDNPAGWQVEAGNVGRHYFEWRYGISPPEYVDDSFAAHSPLGPTPLGSAGDDQDAGATLVIANHGRSDLSVTIQGQTSTEITVEGCLDCPEGDRPPPACDQNAPRQSITLPAGSYAVSMSRAGAVQPLGGIWTLMPDSRYGACFFTFR
jgi:hypothetical protein